MSINEKSDEEIVAIIREKDPELYSEIIRRYKDKLSHYLKKLIKDDDEIEDVLQNVFIKVYKNLYGFNTDKKFSSWIYRIAHNEAINFIKKYAKERTPIEDVEYKIGSDKEEMDDKMDNKLLRKQLESHLDQIKIKYSEPLILFYFQEKSYDEISDILRIPVSTVGTLISRGRQMIKKLIVSEKT